jgi:superfamily II DNA or RNA helicase
MNYIYVRTNEYWTSKGLVKVGGTSSIPGRDSGYVTGEINRGKFELVLEVYEPFVKIEKLIKESFKDLHFYTDACTELYKAEIINQIVPFFNNCSIKFKILSDLEVSKLLRKKYSSEKQKDLIIPTYEQQEVLNKIISFYSQNKIGKVIWPCGLGKTILSLLIGGKLNAKKICICVPWKNLRFQFYNEALNFFKKEDIYINNIPSSKKDRYLVICTYYFSERLNGFHFDFKVGDEAHHLVGNTPDEGKKAYNHFHKIKSEYTLFMTATEKVSECDYSMDSETVFGKIIDQKSFHWAIENKRIADYCIICYKSTIQEIDQIIKKCVKNEIINKKLFLAAYMCIKVMETNPKLTHILCYTNSINDSDLLKSYISMIINEPYFYNESLHSKSTLCLEDELDKFKSSKYGIICSVAQFGEGINIPCLNGVCATEDIGSKIKGTQYLTRHLRLNKNDPNKIGFTLIPVLEDSNLISLVSQLRNIDSGIEEKIKIFTNKNISDSENNSELFFKTLELEENQNELEKIKFKIRLSKQGYSDDEDEYNYEKLFVNK